MFRMNFEDWRSAGFAPLPRLWPILVLRNCCNRYDYSCHLVVSTVVHIFQQEMVVSVGEACPQPLWGRAKMPQEHFPENRMA
jgi:hypothetical protein